MDNADHDKLANRESDQLAIRANHGMKYSSGQKKPVFTRAAESEPIWMKSGAL